MILPLNPIDQPEAKLNLSTYGRTASDREYVFAVPQPDRLGKRHQPLRHKVFLGIIEGELERAGCKIVQQKYVLQDSSKRGGGPGLKDGNLFAVMEVHLPGGALGGHGTYAWIVGARNSNGLDFSAGVRLGRGVICCSNLLFAGGEIAVIRRHTGSVGQDLEIRLREALAGITDHQARIEQRVQRLRSIEVSADRAKVLSVDAHLAGACAGNQIPRIYREFIEPSYEDFAAEPCNLWRWENALTHIAMKDVSPQLVDRRSVELERFMDTLVEA